MVEGGGWVGGDGEFCGSICGGGYNDGYLYGECVVVWILVRGLCLGWMERMMRGLGVLVGWSVGGR